MIPTKQILKFLGIFLGLYILLILVSAAFNINGLYRTAFCGFGSSWYNTFGNKEVLFQFEALDDASIAGQDISIYFINKDELKKAELDAKSRGEANFSANRADWGLNTWFFGLLPCLFLASLLLVTPIPWKRKLISLLAGLLILHLYLIIRLHFEFTHQIALHDWLSSRQLSGVYSSVSDFIKRFMYIEFNYVIAFLIWILVAFRKSDFDKLAGQLRAD